MTTMDAVIGKGRMRTLSAMRRAGFMVGFGVVVFTLLLLAYTS